MTTPFYARARATGPLSPVFAIIENPDRSSVGFVLRGADGVCRWADIHLCQAFEAHETGICGDCRERFPCRELHAQTGRCAPWPATCEAAHPPCEHPAPTVGRETLTGRAYRWCPDCEAELPLRETQRVVRHKDGNPPQQRAGQPRD